MTAGVGHNLTLYGDYQLLAFTVKRKERKAVIGGDKGLPIEKPETIGRAATAAEKKNDYDFLKKHSGLGSYAAEQLTDYTTVEMKPEDVDRLFETDLQDAITIARKTFGEAVFDKYPMTCQAALIDNAFNCGSFSTFHTFCQAIKGTETFACKSWNERWKAAATHSKKGAVNAARDAKIAQWLNAGAT